MRPSCTRRTAASTWSISNVSRNTLWHMQRPVQTVSAYATEAGLVLAQRAVDGKSNEITAIPELLDMLNLKGAIVSIDAMGTQKEIARRIVDKGADYVLALKGNQTSLHEDAALFFADPRARQLFKQFLCENRNPWYPWACGPKRRRSLRSARRQSETEESVLALFGLRIWLATDTARATNSSGRLLRQLYALGCAIYQPGAAQERKNANGQWPGGSA